MFVPANLRKAEIMIHHLFFNDNTNIALYCWVCEVQAHKRAVVVVTALLLLGGRGVLFVWLFGQLVGWLIDLLVWFGLVL